MAFTIYRSTDSGAPLFYGTTGSYIALLDACLVNGYGTKPAVGWSKPFSNTSSAGAFAQGIGGYRQPSGSAFYLFINDNGPGAGTYKECWATGWELLVSPSSSVANTVGSGSNQFPTTAQLLTTGHTVIRKSATADSSSVRQWIVVADSSSFMSFIATGDTANMYYGFGFGDIFSFKGSGSTDAYKCIIMGRTAENSAVGSSDGFDTLSGYITAAGGNFMARNQAGTGTSITLAKHGDGVKGSVLTFSGSVPFPNSTDNGLYLSPIWIVETVNTNIRGQLRGIYQPLHTITNFVDNQVFTGSLDFSGKTFLMVKTTPQNGIYVIETSDTLLTN